MQGHRYGLRSPPEGGGRGSWRGTYRMLKFVVGSLELDSLLTEGSIVDPRCAILE